MSGQVIFNALRTRPDALIVAAYGGGVNSVAAEVWMHLNSYRPHASVMANPGKERPETIAYRDGVFAEWCDSVGFPRVVEISRQSEGRHRPRVTKLETLEQECKRLGNIPAVAYGPKTCSIKHKQEPQRWWFERQEWAQAEWAAGRRITRLIGYDAGEGRRVLNAQPDAWDLIRFTNWYPLIDDGYDRDGCIDLIRSVGLPIPPKSACEWCPNNTLGEWRKFARRNPEDFRSTVEWSRSAAANITSPDVVGFLRRTPPGNRQLHEWFDAGMPHIEGADDDEEDTDDMPCECAL